MSAKPAIPIKPIDFDIAKRAVDEIAVERHVPTTSYTKPEAAGEGRRDEPVKPARSPARKLTVVIPEYLIDAIQQRALASRPRATVRYVVLEALQAIGLHIEPVDLVEDGRRTYRQP